MRLFATNGNLQIARIFGIPIVINVSWLLTLGFVATTLALRIFPAVFPADSPYRDNVGLHWIMALVSGVSFFASIVLHELAHSLVARKQGVAVKNITLFLFGGVSQITGESRRPRHEFLMAIVGPLTSLALAGVFFAIWWLVGAPDATPVGIVLEWLYLMNFVVAVFNLAPAFPMDGGRVLRSLVWGVTGNLLRATRIATLAGRGLGYALMVVGGLTLFGFIDFLDQWNALWFGILGIFLEQSARQSWFQARALNALAQFRAADIMSPELETAAAGERVEYLLSRGRNQRFIFFIEDVADHIIGVLTEKEARPVDRPDAGRATAGELMTPTREVAVAAPADDGASLLQTMEMASIWHLPVVTEGRVIGVVSKENLLRLLARSFMPRRRVPDLP